MNRQRAAFRLSDRHGSCDTGAELGHTPAARLQLRLRVVAAARRSRKDYCNLSIPAVNEHSADLLSQFCWWRWRARADTLVCLYATVAKRQADVRRFKAIDW
jgi:hypothetical protein